VSNYIQKSKIKKLIRDRGFRLSPNAYDGINRSVENLVIKMLSKVEQDGMKTLMEQHTAIGGKTKTVQATQKDSCKKCCNIKPEFLKFARNTQEWCHTKATILSKKV